MASWGMTVGSVPVIPLKPTPPSRGSAKDPFGVGADGCEVNPAGAPLAGVDVDDPSAARAARREARAL